MSKPSRFKERLKRMWDFSLRLVLFGFQLWLFSLIIYRIAPVPITPYMVKCSFNGGHLIQKQWVDFDAVNPSLTLAALTSEDPKFLKHYGFDLEQIIDAIKHNQNGGKLRGASTISQQTAKNLWLLHYKNFIRKGIEACMTLGMEFAWPKQRILEVYFNIIETGPELFGMETASQRYFHHAANSLNATESARLIAVLPNPIRWHPTDNSAYVNGRVNLIQSLKKYVDLDERVLPKKQKK